MGVIEDKKGKLNLLELKIEDEVKYINFSEELYREVTGSDVNNTIFYLPKVREFFMYYNNKRYHVSRERVQYLVNGMGMSSAEALLVSFAMIKDLNNEKDYTLDEVYEFIKGRKTDEIEDFVNNVTYLMKTGFLKKLSPTNVNFDNNGGGLYSNCETVDDVIDAYTKKLIEEEESKRRESFSDDYESIRKLVRGDLLGGWTTRKYIGNYDENSLKAFNILEDNNIKDGNLSRYYSSIWSSISNYNIQFEFSNPKIKEFINKMKGTYLNRAITKTYISNELHRDKGEQRHFLGEMTNKYSEKYIRRKDVLKGVVSLEGIGETVSGTLKNYINNYYTKKTNKNLNGIGVTLNGGTSILDIDYKNDEINYYRSLNPEDGVYEINNKKEKLSEYKFYSNLDGYAKETNKDYKWLKGNNRNDSVYGEIEENLRRAINFNAVKFHRDAKVQLDNDYLGNIMDGLMGRFNFVSQLNKHLVKDFVTEESVKDYIYSTIPYRNRWVQVSYSSEVIKDLNTIVEGKSLFDIKNEEDKKNSSSPRTENLISVEEVNDFARDILYLSEKLIKYSISQNHKDLLSGILHANSRFSSELEWKDAPQVERVTRETLELKRSRLENINYNSNQIYKQGVSNERKRFNKYSQFIKDKLNGNMLDLFTINGKPITKAMNKEYKNYFNKQFDAYVGYVKISKKIKRNNLRDELIRRGLLTGIQNSSTSSSIIEILTLMERIEGIRDRDKLDAIEYILGDCKERQCISRPEALRLYRDYVNMFNSLVEYNMRLGSMFKVKPFSLKLEHDIVVTDFNTIRQQIDDDRFTEVYDENKDLGLSGLELEDSQGRKYEVIEPKTVSELSSEGKELRHCVGSYARRVMEKTSLIYFLRKKENTNKSYVTLEVGKRGNSYKLLQSRGSSNQSYNNELTEKIEKKLNEYNTEAEKTG